MSPLLLLLGAHLVAALVLAVLPGRLRLTALAVAIAPLGGLLVWVLGPGLSAVDGAPITETLSWIPALGVSLDLVIDPLAIVFLLLISGVGAAIVVFSSGYLGTSPRQSRFLALLVLFAGAMAGLVVTDNVFGLFVFWELTTITSYLIIGFEDHKGSARAAALQAVLTTGLGGLVMLGGLVLLAQAADTTSLAAIVATPPAGTPATVGLLLVLVGAFTKSAQAPFHFWLPGAMSAPTPASAYLHSATMVKAGIFLLIRLAPGFAQDPLWSPIVVTVGLATMVIGAWRALRQTDLKLLLAFGTVSQLGFITALVGVGTPVHIHAALAVLVAHALFKSALFLTVGAIDAAAGTRDIRVLSGLGRRLPWLAAGGALAAASMAGVPPLLGFVSKEAAVAALIDESQWLTLIIVAAASVLTVAYSLRFWWGAFATKPVSAEVDHVGSDVARPGRLLAWPPVVLAAIGLVAGMAPAAVDWLVKGVVAAGKLVLWPGWKPALAVSAAIVVLGVLGHVIRDRIARLQLTVARDLRLAHLPTADAVYRGAVAGLNRAADRTTGVVQHGSLPLYLAIILLTVVTLPIGVWVAGGGSFTVTDWAASPAELAVGALAIGAAVAAIRARRRMAAVLLLGAVGYAMAGLFVIYGAPDLALTLLLVDTVSVAAFAFVLSRQPRQFEDRSWRAGRVIRLVVSVIVGGFVTVAALIASQERSEPPASVAYVELAPDAGGTNVVNVILTDFRALDTLGEITVVATAAIGIAALVRGVRSREDAA